MLDIFLRVTTGGDPSPIFSKAGAGTPSSDAEATERPSQGQVHVNPDCECSGSLGYGEGGTACWQEHGRVTPSSQGQASLSELHNRNAWVLFASETNIEGPTDRRERKWRGEECREGDKGEDKEGDGEKGE